MEKGLVSVIIVNYNGLKWLKGCLDSLSDQSYRNFEIIFVDNGSRDDSIGFIEKNYPSVAIVRNEKNSGFAGGNNIGLEKARGEFIVLLNNDTTVEKDYLEKFIQVFRDYPRAGCAQSKMVLMHDRTRLDCAGSFWTSTTFLFHFGLAQEQSLEKYNRPMMIFSAKGASMIIRRDVADAVGLFDDDFWCYYEETDFCHRVWLAGYECWYYPRAVCYHAGGGTALAMDNSFVHFHNYKNVLASFLKNWQWRSLWHILPVSLFFHIGLAFYWLMKGKPRHFLTIFRAIVWNFSHLPSILSKREAVNRLRKVDDATIMRLVGRNPGLRYFLFKQTK